MDFEGKRRITASFKSYILHVARSAGCVELILSDKFLEGEVGLLIAYS